MTRRARAEGSTSTKPAPAARKPDAGFAALIEQFQADYPDEWEAIRLTPTQHGVDAIADKLKA